MRTIFCILLIFISGCTILDKKYYLVVDSENAKTTIDRCGYINYDISRFGKGNKSTVEIDDYTFELCSLAYSGQHLSFGPILPLFYMPTDVRKIRKLGWVRFKNLTPDTTIEIKEINIAEIDSGLVLCIDRYPPTFVDDTPSEKILEKCRHNNTLPKNSLVLGHEDFVWLGLPVLSKFVLKIKLEKNIEIRIKMKETTIINWWMQSV